MVALKRKVDTSLTDSDTTGIGSTDTTDTDSKSLYIYNWSKIIAKELRKKIVLTATCWQSCSDSRLFWVFLWPLVDEDSKLAALWLNWKTDGTAVGSSRRGGFFEPLWKSKIYYYEQCTV